jgi:hypothetical protein
VGVVVGVAVDVLGLALGAAPMLLADGLAPQAASASVRVAREATTKRERPARIGWAGVIDRLLSCG